MTKITLKDLGYNTSNITEKSDVRLFNILENVHSPLYYIKEGFNLMDTELYAANRLDQTDKQLLVEAVSRSNIEKAELILDNSNDKLVKLVKLSKGDITKFKYYNTIKEMIEDLQKAAPSNIEMMLVRSLLHGLEVQKPRFTKAFNNNNIVQKTIYFSSVLNIVHSTIKEHVTYLDVSDSKNKADIVMVEDNHGLTTDKNNIKLLKANAMLIKSKVKSDKLTENSQLAEIGPLGILAASGLAYLGGSVAAKAGVTASGVASGVAAIPGAIDTASSAVISGTNAAISTATTAGTIALSAVQVAILSLVAVAALYFITKFASLSLSKYLESYEYIKTTADKSSLDGDKAISKMIDKMVSVKNVLRKIFQSNKSKNVSEYMKDLNKDVAVVKKYELKQQKENDKDLDTSHSFF